MSRLPKRDSKWIHRETLTPVVVGQTAYDDRGDRRLWIFPPLGGDECVQLADFHRDFIPDGPVTVERLCEEFGWLKSVYDGEAVWKRDPDRILVFSTRDDRVRLTFIGGVCETVLRPPESLRDILLAMKIFEASPTGAKEGNDPC